MYKLEQILDSCVNEFRKKHNLWDTVEDNKTLVKKFMDYMVCYDDLNIDQFLESLLIKKVDPKETKISEVVYG